MGSFVYEYKSEVTEIGKIDTVLGSYPITMTKNYKIEIARTCFSRYCKICGFSQYVESYEETEKLSKESRVERKKKLGWSNLAFFDII